MTHAITSPKAASLYALIPIADSQARCKPDSALETTFAAALEPARRLTDMYGTQNIEVTVAWEVIGELGRAITRQRLSVQTAFDRYCAANPDAPEARIYDV
ncbi:hypothetical protein C1752_14072 [Acaryochloris thomasi RCC1774]|uniref:CP12 domain-containing protein n=1 Tax=Acaryochloris thomasi RCC1774 TaxID=1764569 RepID=A0A2W1JN47_9CYAN|nr:CP12 domain-containing protein [Acaryochloris thomasi]PZD70327.1 hypothetical protein C1752_14072 [Acaryochloris thomasi RCC1774]